jgi:hypothetical protein
MPKPALHEEINDVVVRYLEQKLQADEPVNVVAMANEIAAACRIRLPRSGGYHAFELEMDDTGHHASVSDAPVFADVLTDWNEKTVTLVTPRMVPAAGQRVVAMVQVAMFDAINSIDRRYRPYLVQLPAAPTTSKEAAAATAAGTVLTGLHPQAEAELKGSMTAYLASLPDNEAKTEGIKLGVWHFPDLRRCPICRVWVATEARYPRYVRLLRRSQAVDATLYLKRKRWSVW